MHPGSASARPPHGGAPPPIETAPAPIYPDDVGPLLAAAAALRTAEPLDEVTQALWTEAVSRALTGQISPKPR